MGVFCPASSKGFISWLAFRYGVTNLAPANRARSRGAIGAAAVGGDVWWTGSASLFPARKIDV